VNIAKIVKTEGESGEPLFRMTVTRFTKLNSTSIGLCISHALLDGDIMLLFCNSISQLYQGLEPADPPFYESEPIRFAEPVKMASPVYPLYDLSAPPPWKHPDRKEMEFVRFRLTVRQLTELQKGVINGMEHLRISRADTVVGLLARCLSEIEPESKPIDTISHVVNHRGMGIYPHNLVANAIFWFPTALQVPKDISPRDSILAWATETRKSFGKLKDLKFLKRRGRR